MSTTIGIIGGSGLYDMAELTDREERRVETPFGRSVRRRIVLGTLRGKRVAFLARHGAGHRLLPSELNFRANIYGFKLLGVEYILSASAVGSLKEEVHAARPRHPGSVLRSHEGTRISTFFGSGLVAHVGFAHPFCAPLSDVASRRGGRRVGATVHTRRHLRVHGRAAVLDAGRVEAVPILGHGHHRHDEPPGGEARARGGDLLRHASRSSPTTTAGTRITTQVTVEMIIGNLTQNAKTAQQVIAGTPSTRLPFDAHVRVRQRAQHTRSSRGLRRSPEQTQSDLAPHHGPTISKLADLQHDAGSPDESFGLEADSSMKSGS